MGIEDNSLATDAVFQKAGELPPNAREIRGYDFASGIDYSALIDSYANSGIQAANLYKAIEEVERMLSWSLDDEPVPHDEDEEFLDSKERKRVRTTIFLAFTSNQISCGMREVIKFLVKNKMVQVLVTTAGGIEEDFIKVMKPHLTGEFHYDGRKMRGNGMNRIGNMVVPNDNYCEFEDFCRPLLRQMHIEQNEMVKKCVNLGDDDGDVPDWWTPSRIIKRFGLEIASARNEDGSVKFPRFEDSVFYWAAVNDIPVFSPALTDGSIGDMLYFYLFKHPGFVLDIAADIKKLNDIALRARKTGVLIIGGGLIKHHVMNANLMRNGADFAVYMTTATEHDASDSGASPGEALSWGKIRIDAHPVKIAAEASLYLPILVANFKFEC